MAPTRRATAWLLLAFSLVIAGAGAASLTRMLREERAARVERPIPPPRGAATTVAGMAIGIGLAGAMAGAALLMTSRRG
ncbi:MAG: hypothetical protein AB1635_01970 [Acidobacteriota bacterium]